MSSFNPTIPGPCTITISDDKKNVKVVCDVSQVAGSIASLVTGGSGLSTFGILGSTAPTPAPVSAPSTSSEDVLSATPSDATSAYRSQAVMDMMHRVPKIRNKLEKETGQRFHYL